MNNLPTLAFPVFAVIVVVVVIAVIALHPKCLVQEIFARQTTLATTTVLCAHVLFGLR